MERGTQLEEECTEAKQSFEAAQASRATASDRSHVTASERAAPEPVHDVALPPEPLPEPMPPAVAATTPMKHSAPLVTAVADMPVPATVASDRSHVAAYEHHPDSSAVVPVDEFSDMQSLSADNDWKSCASALNDVLDDLSDKAADEDEAANDLLETILCCPDTRAVKSGNATPK